MRWGAPRHVPRGTSRGEGVGGGGDEPWRQAGTQVDDQDRSEAAAGRGGDQWDITLLHAS